MVISLAIIVTLGILIWGGYNLIQRKYPTYDTVEFAYSIPDLLRQILLVQTLLIVPVTVQLMGNVLFGQMEWFVAWGIGAMVAIPVGYLLKSPLGFAAGVIQWIVTLISAAVVLEGDTHVLIPLSFFLALFAIYAMGVCWDMPKTRRYQYVCESIALISLLGGMLFWGSFANRNLLTTFLGQGLTGNLDVLTLLGMGLMVCILAMIVAVWRGTLTVIHSLMLGIPVLGLVGVWGTQILSFGEMSVWEVDQGAVVLLILFNLIYLLGVLGLLFTGYHYKQIWRLNLGIVALFIFSLQRYFDWFNDSFIDRSVFFIVLGLLFLGLGWVLEQLRSQLVQEITE